ncbi:60S ribosomal protein L2, mitochondrial [Sesamum angolense]|uniref:60S ribosomal protein L2, mitochondrial n=1 Tax=Sesamum angolense TaxID=2727404 RepID=A0AAE1TAZ7_9LAMI|nr:60S ribosomal protein L2, mitochondrial [Sesamum angolense]
MTLIVLLESLQYDGKGGHQRKCNTIEEFAPPKKTRIYHDHHPRSICVLFPAREGGSKKELPSPGLMAFYVVVGLPTRCLLGRRAILLVRAQKPKKLAREGRFLSAFSSPKAKGRDCIPFLLVALWPRIAWFWEAKRRFLRCFLAT